MLVSDGVDYPVGATERQRRAAACPVGWHVTLAYRQYYLLMGNIPTIHTGVDVVTYDGGGYGTPFYAPANAVVTYARDVTGSTWRKLLVLEVTEPDGTRTHIRFGHLKDFAVAEGQTVRRGQLCGHEGNADGAFSPHHHIDVSRSGILRSAPTHWPGNDDAAVRKHYVNPLVYLKENRPMPTTLDTLLEMQLALQKTASLLDVAILAEATPPPPPPPDPIPVPRQAQVIADPELRVRDKPASSGAIVGFLPYKTVVMVVDVEAAPDSLAWVRITEGKWADRYIAKNWITFDF